MIFKGHVFPEVPVYPGLLIYRDPSGTCFIYRCDNAFCQLCRTLAVNREYLQDIFTFFEQGDARPVKTDHLFDLGKNQPENMPYAETRINDTAYLVYQLYLLNLLFIQEDLE